MSGQDKKKLQTGRGGVVGGKRGFHFKHTVNSIFNDNLLTINHTHLRDTPTTELH